MRFRRDEETGESIINMESLLDVVFILLIFFMATTTFKEEEYDRKVKLTAARKKHSSLSGPANMTVINVRSKDRNKDDALYVVGGKRVNRLQLRKIVTDAVKRDANHKVLIRGDRKALHGDVAMAVAECHIAGVDEAKIGYSDTPTD